MEQSGPRLPGSHEITKLSALRSLLPIARELQPFLTLVIVNQCVCLLVLLTGSAVPFGLKHLAEQIFSGNQEILLWAPPLVFVIMSFLAFGHMIRGLLSQYISIKVAQNIQKRIFSHFLGEDILDLHKHPVGEKMSRITYDIEWFVQGTSIFLSETLFLPLVIFGSTGIMFYFNWQIAVITIIVSPLGLITAKPFSKHLRKSSMSLQTHYAILSHHILDSLRGLLLVKVFAREKRENEQLDSLLSTFAALNVNNNLWAGLFRTALSIGNALVICLVTWCAFYLLTTTSTLSVPNFIAISSVMIFFFGEVSKLGGVMNTLTKAAASIERIFSLLQEKTNHQEAGKTTATFNDALSFKDVSFSYGNAIVFENVTLSIKPGEKIALMGMSGAGKTTFIHLMLGLIQPQSGQICFDGNDINQLNTVSLRNLFGYSPQQSVLFHATVAENIAYSRPDATRDETIEAAKISCAHDFIMALPQGYETRLGDDGANLSEGQRQRLALARGILRNAPILVLDESSAHVDLHTERKIYQNIKRLENKTIILVSHRPSVLREADRIFVIADSKVKDIGSFSSYASTISQNELLGNMEFIH